jgi:hypothetical protein
MVKNLSEKVMPCSCWISERGKRIGLILTKDFVENPYCISIQIGAVSSEIGIHVVMKKRTRNQNENWLAPGLILSPQVALHVSASQPK